MVPPNLWRKQHLKIHKNELVQFITDSGTRALVHQLLELYIQSNRARVLFNCCWNDKRAGFKTKNVNKIFVLANSSLLPKRDHKLMEGVRGNCSDGSFQILLHQYPGYTMTASSPSMASLSPVMSSRSASSPLAVPSSGPCTPY